jgi:hypothetical protein
VAGSPKEWQAQNPRIAFLGDDLDQSDVAKMRSTVNRAGGYACSGTLGMTKTEKSWDTFSHLDAAGAFDERAAPDRGQLRAIAVHIKAVHAFSPGEVR